MSTRSIQTWCAFDLYGFQFGDRKIVWDTDSERPTMFVLSADGVEMSCRVASRSFDVPPGPIAKRRPAMRKAALEFFAPLIEVVA